MAMWFTTVFYWHKRYQLQAVHKDVTTSIPSRYTLWSLSRLHIIHILRIFGDRKSGFVHITITHRLDQTLENIFFISIFEVIEKFFFKYPYEIKNVYYRTKKLILNILYNNDKNNY